MIGVSWNYPVFKFFVEEVEARSGNVAAGSILLEPVLSFHSCVSYRWLCSSFLYLVQIHIAIYETIESHHWKTTLSTMPSRVTIFSKCAFLHSTPLCWRAGVQYRSFGGCRGDLNAYHFSSLHITLLNPSSRSIYHI